MHKLEHEWKVFYGNVAFSFRLYDDFFIFTELEDELTERINSIVVTLLASDLELSDTWRFAEGLVITVIIAECWVYINTTIATIELDFWRNSAFVDSLFNEDACVAVVGSFDLTTKVEGDLETGDALVAVNPEALSFEVCDCSFL